MRDECLEAVKSEHKRLGRPIRKYAAMRVAPQDMPGIVTQLIQNGEDLHYNEPDPNTNDDDDHELGNDWNESRLQPFGFTIVYF